MTQRELAARLGLSYATVSRVFNGDARVTEPTRRRVLGEAERLGFRGHALARALRLKKSFAIGMIGANTGHGYWADVLAAMETEARGAGYHVIICHRERGAASGRQVRFLLDRQVDALVMSPHPREDPGALREVERAGVPLLLINSPLAHFPAHYLGTDSRAGSRAACEYLLALGHRRIAFAAGPEGEYTARCRLEGYRDALRAAGLAAGEWVVEAGWRREEGAEAARRLLAGPELPTAVAAVNDAAAIGLFLELRRRGVRIPEDVSLVGYSGDPAGELLACPLTTVSQPAERLGRRAARLALELIAGKHDRPVFEELADALLPRASCAPPAAESGKRMGERER